MLHRPRPLSIMLVLVVALLGVLIAADAHESQLTLLTRHATPATAPAASAEILAHGTPAAAPDQELSLARVTVPPGAIIAPHEHPGLQLASIVSGTLTYTVLTGEVTLTRAATSGTPGPVERITAGQTVAIRPGDWVAETPGNAHMAQNAGAEPVVILISRLFTAGEPASIPAPATPMP